VKGVSKVEKRKRIVPYSSGEEQDYYGKLNYAYLNKPGKKKRIKRRHHKRERRELKNESRYDNE